jgi:hypothetical protein
VTLEVKDSEVEIYRIKFTMTGKGMGSNVNVERLSLIDGRHTSSPVNEIIN